MKNSLLAQFESDQMQKLNPQLPDFRPGDTVIVRYKIQEGAKMRIQAFEGVVIRYKKGGINSTYTVRKRGAGGIGVERVFPVFSSNVESVSLKAQGKVRQARLFYLRQLSGKAARIKSRITKRGSEKKEAAN